ncbi:Conserved_hypothetical protein [Hexamita inflata]|uniref:Uncharacterized protein n=1 Tax=Hexamita inflata TaxID=28002 RepID=A0AA86P7N7_9EUKA|nr:Conserved hypothetical protein [Hexamita inflata]CAI9939232.1 Conserved hypothetical protein [Hexamita inflata]CAI9965570.1 Conserved hypothetical protein [Hexamita inflata]
MNINDFIINEFISTNLKDGFALDYAFSTIPLFKTRKEITEEQIIKRQIRKSQHAIVLNNQVFEVTYQTCLKMNELFKDYIKRVNNVQMADLHGASIKIVRSKCPSYIGVTGIISQELPDLIVIVKENNQQVKINKKLIDFIIEDQWYFVGKIRSQKHKAAKRWDLDL